jgi:hypothetical protein
VIQLVTIDLIEKTKYILYFSFFILDVINESDFQEILREYCHENDVNNWKPLSTVRYNSVIANRGIIKSKGFFIYAKRELHT